MSWLRNEHWASWTGLRRGASTLRFATPTPHQRQKQQPHNDNILQGLPCFPSVGSQCRNLTYSVIYLQYTSKWYWQLLRPVYICIYIYTHICIYMYRYAALKPTPKFWCPAARSCALQARARPQGIDLSHPPRLPDREPRRGRSVSISICIGISAYVHVYVHTSYVCVYIYAYMCMYRYMYTRLCDICWPCLVLELELYMAFRRPQESATTPLHPTPGAVLKDDGGDFPGKHCAPERHRLRLPGAPSVPYAELMMFCSSLNTYLTYFKHTSK